MGQKIVTESQQNHHGKRMIFVRRMDAKGTAKELIDLLRKGSYISVFFNNSKSIVTNGKEKEKRILFEAVHFPAYV